MLTIIYNEPEQDRTAGQQVNRGNGKTTLALGIAHSLPSSMTYLIVDEGNYFYWNSEKAQRGSLETIAHRVRGHIVDHVIIIAASEEEARPAVNALAPLINGRTSATYIQVARIDYR